MYVNWKDVTLEVVPFSQDSKHKQVKLTFGKGDELRQPTGETVEILLPWGPAKDIGNWLLEMSRKAREGS